MPKTDHKEVDDFISSLNINGMHGRMLCMPAPKGKTREILFIYGHHSSLERWWGVLQNLNDFGAVTAPDLPGFGGMDSFYKIGKEPTIDALADYLATFIKLRYKRKRIDIVGLSFGFVVVTRMLQRYPDLAKKVDMLVSFVGFAHKNDFTFSPIRYRLYRIGSALFTHRLPALIFRHVVLNAPVLHLAYAKTHNAKSKFEGMTRLDRKKTMKFEVLLWQRNDVRTRWHTCHAFLTLDNCHKKVDLPVWHISVDADRYFDNHVVEQHMRVIFNDFHGFKSKMKSHAPSVIAEKKDAAYIIPNKIRQMLSEKGQ